MVDLPKTLYRQLKACAALSGLKVHELITYYLEQRLWTLPEQRPTRARSKPPVAVPPTGRRIPALSCKELARIEEAQEIARLARSARR